MTRDQVNQYLAAILTTLAEVHPENAAEITLYLALGGDINKWSILKQLLLEAKLVTVLNFRVSLTEKGKELAERITTLAQ